MIEASLQQRNTLTELIFAGTNFREKISIFFFSFLRKHYTLIFRDN